MPAATLDDVELYYEIHGEGAPLLLIAGLASDSQSWQPIIQDLSRHYRVITFDNRGAGRTTPHGIEISIRNIADDAIALVKHLGLSSANVLGHSMGGFVALDCAIRHPERVSRLILAATSAFSSKRNNSLFLDWASFAEAGMDSALWFKNIFYWIFAKRFFEDEKALNASIQAAIEYPYPQTATAFKNQVDAIKSFNCEGNLPSIAAKTMVLHGTEDLLFPPDESSKILSAIPDVLFASVERAAHSIHVENPADFINLVQTFLKQP